MKQIAEIGNWQLPLEVNREEETLKKDIIDAYSLLNDSHSDMIYFFLRLIQEREGFYGDYWRVYKITEILARNFNFSSEEMLELKLGALLRDIGKYSIPADIWEKSGKLTREEYDYVKKHPLQGYEIVKDYVNDNVSKLILCHHEFFNGKGYPLGLKAHDIPLGARIIGLADMYNALRSKRPYRGAFSRDEALEIMNSEKGMKLDPYILEEFWPLVGLVERELADFKIDNL